MSTPQPTLLVVAGRPGPGTHLRHGTSFTGSTLQALEKLKLQCTWKVIQEDINTFAKRREPASITFCDATHWSASHLQQATSVLAEGQGVGRESGFIVLGCPPGRFQKPEERMSLLRTFPQPAKVEIAFDRKEIQRTLLDLAIKHMLLASQSRDPKEHKADVESKRATAPPRKSPLDSIPSIVQSTEDLRENNGRLSVKKIAGLYGLNVSLFARWLGCSRQALSKTPDAQSLQNALAYFERIARLRTVLSDDDTFRKWLRMPNPALGKTPPVDMLKRRKWQQLADMVDDIITGNPS